MEGHAYQVKPQSMAPSLQKAMVHQKFVNSLKQVDLISIEFATIS